MIEVQPDKETHLINAFARYGVTISLVEIPDVLRLGADTFLIQKGVIIPEKPLLEIYLILSEMKLPLK